MAQIGNNGPMRITGLQMQDRGLMVGQNKDALFVLLIGYALIGEDGGKQTAQAHAIAFHALAVKQFAVDCVVVNTVLFGVKGNCVDILQQQVGVLLVIGTRRKVDDEKWLH